MCVEIRLYELAVRKQFNYFNGDTRYTIDELESGEALEDLEDLGTAEYIMNKMISDNPQKYFTRQKMVVGYAYRLKRLGGGSDKYGICEICHKGVDSVYSLTQMKSYWNTIDLKYGITHNNCFTKFGHRSCLADLT